MTPSVVLITGAASGFGRLSAEALAMAGHTVYASMRGTAGHDAAQVAAIAGFAQTNDAVVAVVDAPFGKRPFRVHVDSSEDGGQVGFTVLDRLKTEMMYRTGLSALLHVAT